MNTEMIGAREHEAARTPLWRTAVHESGHIATSRCQDLECSGSSVVAGDGYLGLTWSAGSTRAWRGKAAYDSDGRSGHDAVAVRVADNISQFMPGDGESRDGVSDIFSSVQAHAISLMGGAAAEMVMLETRHRNSWKATFLVLMPSLELFAVARQAEPHSSNMRIKKP